MKLKKIALGALAALVVAGTAGWFSLDKETRALLKTAPTNRDLLFWSVPQRDAAFRALDRISLLAKWHVIPASSAPKPLPQGEPLKLPIDLDAYMASQRSAAQRQAIHPTAQISQAFGIACQHFHIGHQVMTEGHWLCHLQVCKARHRCGGVLRSQSD